MIVLDTNVLSALMRPAPDTNVVDWLDRQPQSSVWTTSITVFEIRFGLQTMAAGKRRSALLHAFDVLLEKIDHRVAAFDVASAQQAASLMASRQKKGRLVDLRDTMIGGIVLANHASLATRNTPHFEDIGTSVINPWIS
jgi:toxin FitB